MSDRLRERVTELLDGAESGVDSLPALEEDRPEADLRETLRDESDLLESAADARELVEKTDSRELLSALGMEELPDGSEPKTIPEAIARGDRERVDDLRVLVKLAKLADDGESEGRDLRRSIEELREAVDGPDGVDAETVADSGRPDESSDTESELGSTVASALEGFGDDVRDFRDRLEGLSDGDDGADASDPEDSAESDDDRTAFSGTGSSGRSTMYSTMAPSPSERADMKGVARLSTMPKRNRSDEGD